MQELPVRADSAQVDVEALLRAAAPSSNFLETIPLSSLVVNMVVGVALALALQWLYKRNSTSLSNHGNFAKVFPILIVTTILIITVVKSSLALSLGLVGALSIVRFRTPIKEPEELAYLFICIAIGLGLGAAQTMATLAGTAIVFATIGLTSRRQKKQENKNLYLSIAWRSNNSSPGIKLEKLNEVITNHTRKCDLRRMDSHDHLLEASYFVEFASDEKLASLVDTLENGQDSIEVTFVDQSRLTGH